MAGLSFTVATLIQMQQSMSGALVKAVDGWGAGAGAGIGWADESGGGRCVAEGR